MVEANELHRMRGRAVRATAIEPFEEEAEAMRLAAFYVKILRGSRVRRRIIYRIVQLLLIGLCREFMEVGGVLYMKHEVDGPTTDMPSWASETPPTKH